MFSSMVVALQTPIEFGVIEFSSVPDILRVLAVIPFGWIAVKDLKTRHVSNKAWIALACLGGGIVMWELLTLSGQVRNRYILRLVVSLGVLVPGSYAVWRFIHIGGADSKAVMAIAILFPVAPDYAIGSVALPYSTMGFDVFSASIVINSIVLIPSYFVIRFIINAFLGKFANVMIAARPVRWPDIHEANGSICELSSDYTNEQHGFTVNQLDLDVLRAYLKWRGVTLTAIREDPDEYRSHETGGSNNESAMDDVFDDDTQFDDNQDWGIRGFADEVDPVSTSDALYLYEFLEGMTRSERGYVWVENGIPLLVPLFFGLVFSFTIGSILSFVAPI